MGFIIPQTTTPLFGTLSQETVNKVKLLLTQKEANKLNPDVTLSKKEIKKGLDVSPKEAAQIYKLMNLDGKRGISSSDIMLYEVKQELEEDIESLKLKGDTIMRKRWWYQFE